MFTIFHSIRQRSFRNIRTMNMLAAAMIIPIHGSMAITEGGKSKRVATNIVTLNVATLPTF